MVAMNRDPLLDLVAETARARGFPDDEVVLCRLLAWMDGVLEASTRVNLTAAKSREAALDALVLSALAVTCAVEEAPRCVVDLGTGNGLPGVAAALAWPEAEVLLVERRKKKADAVAALAREQGIENVEVFAVDGRELRKERPGLRADFVTIRAVGTLEATTAVAAPWLSVGGRIAHWKGRGLDAAEIDAGTRAAKAAGLVVLEPLCFEDRAGPAHLVRYERDRPERLRR